MKITAKQNTKLPRSKFSLAEIYLQRAVLFFAGYLLAIF